MGSLLAVVAATVLAMVLGRVVHRRLGFVTRVESISMAPTLAPGQRLLARRQHRSHTPRRGEVVVVDSAHVGRTIIKRVVGLPGEHVEIRTGGRVRIADRELVEPYVIHQGGPAGVFDVPAGHLLLLGDHRAASSDARSWRHPFVPVDSIIGRVVVPAMSSPAMSSPAIAADPGSPRRAAAPAG